MAQEPTKVLPPQNYNDNNTRLLPPPYPGQERPEVITHTVITTVPAVVVTARPPIMGRFPATIVCRSCNIQITTRIDRKSTTKTHLIALLLCLVGCWPCVFIPYCTKSCRNADHYCPNCNAFLGTYQS